MPPVDTSRVRRLPPPPPPLPKPQVAKASPPAASLPGAPQDTFAARTAAARAPQALSGARPPAPPQQAATRDARTLQTTARSNPAYAARQLEDNLQAHGKDPAYKQALLNDPAFQDSVKTLGAQLSGDHRPPQPQLQAAVDSLTHATELVGPRDASKLTDAFAQGLPDHVVGVGHDDQLGGALQRSIEGGKGALFSTGLANSLAAQQRPTAADDVAKAAHQGIESVRKDFDDKANTVARLEGQLSTYVQGFGPTLTPQQQQSAIKAFRDAHKSDYDAWEAAGGKLSSTLTGAEAALRNPDPVQYYDPAYVVIGGETTAQSTHPLPPFTHYQELVSEAQTVGRDLPNLGQTAAGLQAIGDAVAAQGRGEPSILDHTTEIVGGSDDPKKTNDALAPVVAQAAALESINLARSGRAGETKAVLDGLDKNAGLFNATPEQLKEATDELRKLRPGLSTDQLAEISKRFGQHVDALATKAGVPEDSAGLKGLKAFDVVLSAVNATNGWKDFNEEDLKGKIGTVAESVSAGSEGSSLVLEAFGKSAELAKFTGGAATGVGAVLAGADAVQSFVKGDVPGGLASSAIAVGGLVTAGAALEVIPGAGTVVGSGLILAGTAAKAIVDVVDSNDKNQQLQDGLKEYLKGAGLPDGAADALSHIDNGRNVGPFITQIARQEGGDPHKYLQYLKDMPPEQLARLVRIASQVDVTDADRQLYKQTAPSDRTTYLVHDDEGAHDDPTAPAPASLRGAAVWLDEHGLGRYSLGVPNF